MTSNPFYDYLLLARRTVKCSALGQASPEQPRLPSPVIPKGVAGLFLLAKEFLMESGAAPLRYAQHPGFLQIKLPSLSGSTSKVVSEGYFY